MFFLGVPDFDVTVLTHPWMAFSVEGCFCALQWESGWETDVINLGPAGLWSRRALRVS